MDISESLPLCAFTVSKFYENDLSVCSQQLLTQFNALRHAVGSLEYHMKKSEVNTKKEVQTSVYQRMMDIIARHASKRN
jgi:hypothetical protein